MPRKSREGEIVKAIREYLVGAVNRFESITDERLMKVANCARATYYKYVIKDSEIDIEIAVARAKQRKYVESVKRGDVPVGDDLDLRKRLKEAEEGNRQLLAFIASMTANLIMYNVPLKVIQRAQREAIPHPNRSYSHAGRGRRRK
jgi:hypothetical protein